MRAVILSAIVLVGCARPFAEDERVQTQTVETLGAPLSCAEGWGSRVDSFAGIDGSYERLGGAPVGEMTTLVLFAVEDPKARVVSEANAVRMNECGSERCPVEKARVSLLPEGTAMNPMIIFSSNGFNRTDPDMRGFYAVLGLERDDWGAITALCLQRFDEEGTPFLMGRSE
jgi:hypothetical protein